MRRKLLLFIVANVVVFGTLIHIFWPLICLLFLTGENDRIALADIPTVIDGKYPDGVEPVVPKIIHQTWITCHVPALLSGNCTTKPLPEKWKEAYETVKSINYDYEYKLWSDQNSRDFIQEHYSWFLDTWDGYSYPIQRADAIRYFAIHYYGGIYIDMDDGSQRKLDPLLVFPAWVRRTTPTGIGNDVIGAVPNHPFIARAMNSLKSYDLTWPTPYITIMASTGPLFFSLMWRHYNLSPDAKTHRIHLLFPDEYMGTDWSFFVHHVGNSWHQWDANLMFWMRSHWILLTIGGFIVGGGLIFGCWWCGNFISRRRKMGKWKYTPIKEAEN